MIPDLIKNLRQLNSQLIETNDRVANALGTLMGHTPEVAEEATNTEPYCQVDEISQLLRRFEHELGRQRGNASRLEQFVGNDTPIKATAGSAARLA